MPFARIEVVHDRNKKTEYANKNGTIFVKGEMPVLRKNSYEHDCCIEMSTASVKRHAGALIVSGTAKKEIISLVEKQKKGQTIFVCFGGNQSEFIDIKKKYEKNDKVVVINLSTSKAHYVEISWERKNKEDYWCQIVLKGERDIVSVAPKKESKNVDVPVQKPSVNKKANK